VAEHSIQSFANGGKNHAGTSGFRARGGSTFADLSKNFRSGMAWNNRDGNDATAGGFYFFTTDDLVPGPVTALDQHVGEQARDDFTRCRRIENQNSVHAFERGENFGSLAFGKDRTPGAFELADAGVAVEAHDERIAESAGLLEAPDVARMQQIEAAVGEDDAAAVAFLTAKPQNRFLDSQNIRAQRNSMKADAKTKRASTEKLVYHAREARRLRGGRLS